MATRDSLETGAALSPDATGHRADALSEAAKSFSPVLGGPTYQFLLRIGLLRPPLDRVGGRMVALTLLAWAPLLVLSAVGGRLVGGVRIPFLRDLEMHVRLLVSLPLLVAAEVTVHRRIRTLVTQFVDRRIVGPALLPRFEECIMSAGRLRDSRAVELGLVVFVVAMATYWLRGVVSLQADSWYSAAGAGRSLSPAGWWYACVSLPLVQFLTLRWYFRLVIWSRLLWQVSRMDLTLVPTHPDRSCGLGFLEGVVPALGPLLLAHSVLLAGFIGNRILYDGSRLPDYWPEIAALAVFLFVIALGPVSVFAPRLIRQRIHGLHAYGSLASEYVIAFDRKWVGGERPAGEPLVGSSDIQSLADLSNSFAIVENIRPFPFGRRALVVVAVFVALPLCPLVLTMFSLQEIAARLVQVVL